MIDQRILLETPRSIKINDRLARNDDLIEKIEILENEVIVKTRFSSHILPMKQVHVWRLTD